MTEQSYDRSLEGSGRRRLEKLMADTVTRIRATADQIEREARRNIETASASERDLDFQTYPRVAGQVVHSIQTLLFNTPLDSMIDAAVDAETGRMEDRTARIIAAALAVADENREGDTPDSAAVRELVRAADEHQGGQR